MRVLMLGWEFPPHISGGLGTACFGMTQALARTGTEIIFVLPRLVESSDTGGHVTLRSASGTRVRHEVMSLGTRVHELWEDKLTVRPVDALLIPYTTPESYEEYLRWRQQAGLAGESEASRRHWEGVIDLRGGYGPDLMSEVFRYSQAAAAIALQEDFDVIHAHDWMTYPAAMLIKRITGKPLVTHIHATEFDRSGRGVNHEVARIERMGMEYADLVVAVSHFTNNIVQTKYGIPAEKMRVVHNAVARSDVQAKYAVTPEQRHEKRVLFLGRVTFQKGPDYFIEAAKLVLDIMPHVRFFMAGSGDMLPRIIRRAGQLRIGNRFHFTGFLRGKDVDRIFAISDLYVMPSVSEPFGITPLEAMLYDVPVLLSKQSGVSEVLQHALKVDFWDTREMANKICAVLSYPRLAEVMVKNCREEMRNIRWSNAAELLNTLYRELRARRGA
ncbi:MAG: glycosyltransferase [Betaproteobacteria bacterium]|nr:glycosyltransferase [Betaproteobacteria bacterium]